jgi:hypothetical protein
MFPPPGADHPGIGLPADVPSPYSSSVDDRQRQPRDSDREQLSARINRAHDEGRIGLADRDIRLGNVRSAQSMAELDLMTRELDQLDAAIPPPVSGPGEMPYSRFEPGAAVVDEPDDGVPDPASIPTRGLGVIVSVVLAIALVVAGVVFVSYRAAQTDDDGPAADPGAQPEPASQAPASPGGVRTTPAKAPPASKSYSLSEAGIRGFLQTYRKRFGTSRVVDLTLYGGYAIVDVPVSGKARQTGWLYRDEKWTGFGGTRAVFPGSQVIDTNLLAVPPLVRNIKRARATLNVELPADTYVIVRSIRPVDDVPSVDIHVTNKYQESGYLATRLDGTVERAFPYAT